MNSRIRFLLGILLSALSGVMLLLAFPPYGIWWLAWFAFVPGIFAQYRLFPQEVFEPGTGDLLAGLAGPVYGEAVWHGVWPVLHLSWRADRAP